MKISPVKFQINYTDNQNSPKDFMPNAVRYNSLHDLEFDIIADKIRSENLKNQMNKKLSQLKRNISGFINRDKM